MLFFGLSFGLCKMNSIWLGKFDSGWTIIIELNFDFLKKTEKGKSVSKHQFFLWQHSIVYKHTMGEGSSNFLQFNAHLICEMTPWMLKPGGKNVLMKGYFHF